MPHPHRFAFVTLAVLLLALTAHAQPVWTDGDFIDENWDVIKWISPGDSGASTINSYWTIGHGGNPSAMRTTSVGLGASPDDGAMVVHLHVGALWNPALEGEILSIDAGLDFLALNDAPTMLVIMTEQDAKLFKHVLATGAADEFWTSYQGSALTAADFTPLDPADTGQPDFSTDGGPLRFGFATGQFRSATPGSDIFIGGVDNWSVTLTVDPILAADDGRPTPALAVRPMVHPNPFNPTTTISFTLPTAGAATLRIHDPAGRLVASLIDGELNAGPHAVSWHGADTLGRPVGSGVYLVVLETAAGQETSRMSLVR